MKKIAVLGAGMVGKAMAIDLAKTHQVTSIDLFPPTDLDSYGIETVKADLSKAEVIKELVQNFDLIIGAVPGHMGFETLKAVIEAGKNIVDISFFPEDPVELDELAKEKGVIAVMDCGVAPGMDNIFIGHHYHKMEVLNFECYVGGLPQIRTFPFEYKAPFSPIDVIEEYTRPARLVENGVEVVKPALTEPEYMQFAEIGTLEAFNTDGLRSLITTVPCPDMKEKTLRYPGHIQLIKALKAAGFFSEKSIELNQQSIRPIDFTSQLLFDQWKLKDQEAEFTVMRVIISGLEDGIKTTYQYDLLDRYDPATNTSSMARTTGYTCTAVANLVLEDDYNRVGISPPEYVGMTEGCKNKVLSYLEARGIHYHCTKN